MEAPTRMPKAGEHIPLLYWRWDGSAGKWGEQIEPWVLSEGEYVAYDTCGTPIDVATNMETAVTLIGDGLLLLAVDPCDQPGITAFTEAHADCFYLTMPDWWTSITSEALMVYDRKLWDCVSQAQTHLRGLPWYSHIEFSEEPARVAYVRIALAGVGAIKKIDVEDLKRALSRAMVKDICDACPGEDITGDPEQWDVCVVDAILQTAVLGEVTFA